MAHLGYVIKPWEGNVIASNYIKSINNQNNKEGKLLILMRLKKDTQI